MVADHYQTGCGSRHCDCGLAGAQCRTWPPLQPCWPCPGLPDKTQQRKHFIWPLLALGALAFFCSYLLGSSHFWLSFVLLCIAGAALYAPYGPFFALIPELLPANVFGGAIGLINACGALGAFVGSWIVGYLIGLTGNPGGAYI